MSSLTLKKCCPLLVFVLCFSFTYAVKSSLTINGTVFIDGKRPIAKTDENFVCATLDWWPPESCNNGGCSWGGASLLNLDLKNAVLLNAIKAFSPLRIRMGGTLQDQVIYQTKDNNTEPCVPFAQSSSGLFGFTNGCLPLARWDELNYFLNQSGAISTFGLNALNGKTIQPNNTATGPWDSSNAASLIRYTFKKGYNIYGWELGNELGGRPISIGVAPDPYASDTMALHKLIQEIYRGVSIKPKILAPGGNFDRDWFEQYVAKTSNTLDVLTLHIYNLGRGYGPEEQLIQKILDPTFLDGVSDVLKSVEQILKNSGTSAVAWVSEAGGISHSGRDGVSNAFIFSFWYLDQLGLTSVYGTKTYCRQSLIGGNYGLLDTNNFVPNPDYYSALLWHRLMGSYVLSTNFTGTKMIRAYAHCAKQSNGITILLINLGGNTTVHAEIDINGKQESEMAREEYHLTPMNGNIQSKTVLLNGKGLRVGSSGTIPALRGVTANSLEPIKVAPYSVVFVHMPNVVIPACKLSELKNEEFENKKLLVIKSTDDDELKNSAAT
ncbi:hypothetical protein ACJIZ3_020571 [Penstemon smallii]|uniref:Heparanase-like protein 3 n=1 Tax=Penstemon smallii TaxID=265156 RepID=A0ABD3SJR2_9LAMI